MVKRLKQYTKKGIIGATLYLAGYITPTSEENLNVEPCEICLRQLKMPVLIK